MNVFLFLYVHILFPLFLKFWNKRPPKISDFKINAPGVYSREYGKSFDLFVLHAES